MRERQKVNKDKQQGKIDDGKKKWESMSVETKRRERGKINPGRKDGNKEERTPNLSLTKKKFFLKWNIIAAKQDIFIINHEYLH